MLLVAERVEGERMNGQQKLAMAMLLSTPAWIALLFYVSKWIAE